jgi:hypothetical protein
MPKGLLASVVIGGAVSLVSLVALVPTRARPAQLPPPSAPPPAPGPLAAAHVATPEDAPLAPSWTSERSIDGPPVSLTASDGSGLTLAALRASAVVEGPLAFTEMTLAFDNPENRVREGTFKIVLPQGASLGRFAMKINDVWQEGEVVPKERARVAYEDALHRKQDPALLERGDANEFTARVFPIPPHGRKEIIMSYAEELVGGAPYALPLRGLPEVGVLDVSVGGEGATPVRMHREHFAPTADFVMESGKRPVPQALRAGRLVVVRVKPVAEAMPEPIEKAIVLVDTSASRALGLAAELRSVRSLLKGLAERHGGEIPVTVAAFDQEVVGVYQGDANGFGEAQMDRLVSRRALGASNIEKALGWARGEAKRTGANRVVLVTDAVPTAGEEDAAKLAKAAAALGEGGAERLDVVAVGGLRDDALAKKLVTAGLAHDGVVVAAADGVVNTVRRLEAGTKSAVAVAVEGASWSYPKTLQGVQPGDEALVFAELEEGEPLKVRVGGGGARAIDAVPADRPLVERAWARAKIASLEAEERDQGKSLEIEKKIVDLSTGYRVLSAYTALLVLETDADYARFRIDRRALADILSVRDGQLAWTKRDSAPVRSLVRPDVELETVEPVRAETAPAPLENEARNSFGAGGLGLSGFGEGAGGSGAVGTAHGRLGGEPGESQAGKRSVAADMAPAGEAQPSVAAAPAPPPAEPMRAAPARARSASETLLDDRRQAAARPIAGAAPIAALAGGGSGAPREEDRGLDPHTGKFKLVKDRLARGDHAGAYAIASSWQASDPGNVLALVSLGETFEAQGDTTAAARAYGSIIDLFPSRADLRRFAGERLEHVKGNDAADLAIDTFDKARRDRPDHPASHRLAAFARIRRGEYASAFDILIAGLAQHYPEDRFRGVDRILREDLGLVAAAWMKADPGHKDAVLERLRSAGGSIEDGPSIRFVLNWETDANDVDFHIRDARGGHAFYAAPHLPSGGDLYADVTTGYGPECFTVRLPKGQRPLPYTLQAHYFSRGPMGYGMGKLEIVEHDGHGGLKFDERPFVVMVDHAFVDLGTVN